MKMTEIKLIPLGSRIMILPDDVETKTSGGLIIPDTATEKPSRGIIVAVGGKVEELSVGYTVYYGKYAGSVLQDDGISFVVMREDEVMAYIVGGVAKEA